MFKIALTAGHYKYTAGKRCLKALDPKETREWWLNDRIADKVEKLLKDYEGYQLLRTDDTTGEKNISLTARTNAANNFKADFYLSIHHNAGVNGGSGGGIVAFVYTKVDQTTKDWQKALYNSLIKHTGLKGNRATPLASANLHEVRETAMPAVLLELGFMDSKVDTPIILTEAYADKCAAAIVEVLVARGGLKKKQTKTEDKMERYNTLAEVPTWAQATIRKLINAKALSGSGTVKDADGYPADLDLSHDMVRLLVINDRQGLYD